MRSVVWALLLRELTCQPNCGQSVTSFLGVFVGVALLCQPRCASRLMPTTRFFFSTKPPARCLESVQNSKYKDCTTFSCDKSPKLKYIHVSQIVSLKLHLSIFLNEQWVKCVMWKGCLVLYPQRMIHRLYTSPQLYRAFSLFQLIVLVQSHSSHQPQPQQFTTKKNVFNA